MIQLTRLNAQPLMLNSDLIKWIEHAPDTVITLVNGDKIVVRETGEQILELIVGFRRRVLEGLPKVFCSSAPSDDEAARAKSEAGTPQGA